MGELPALGLRVALIGIGATLVLDIWSFGLKTVFRLPSPSYAMVGRWIGYFPRGRFAHASIAKTPAIAGEHIIGWMAHYGIGVLYAGLLIAAAGVGWPNAPTLLPALAIGVATVAAPFFIMQPAMGQGVASSKTPNPNVVRLRSLAAHTVFGIGLYLTALSLSFMR